MEEFLDEFFLSRETFPDKASAGGGTAKCGSMRLIKEGPDRSNPLQLLRSAGRPIPGTKAPDDEQIPRQILVVAVQLLRCGE
jgi:hypothetical protein